MNLGCPFFNILTGLYECRVLLSPYQGHGLSASTTLKSHDY